MLTPALIFAKPWRAGVSKTRLAGRVGEQWASRLAAAMLHDTWAKVSSVPDMMPILVTTDPSFDHGVAGEVWPQGEGDLGERLERAFTRAFSQHGWAVALGADFPAMPAERLSQARTALETHDAVVGPAKDGGYYLLALKSCPSGLLAGLPWSTERTLQATIERFKERGMTTAQLPLGADIDHFANVVELLRSSVREDCPLTHDVATQLCDEIQSKVPAGSST